MLPAFAYGALLGLAVGLLAGFGLERARRAWADLRALKAQIPVLRKLAWLLSKKAAGVTVLGAAVLVWSLYTLAEKGP